METGAQSPLLPPHTTFRRVLKRLQLAPTRTRAPWAGTLFSPKAPIHPIQSGHQLPLVSWAPATDSSSVATSASLVQYWYFPASGGFTTPGICPLPPNTNFSRRQKYSVIFHTLSARAAI